MKTTVAYIIFCIVLLGMYWYYVQWLKKEQVKRTAIFEKELEASNSIKRELEEQNELLSKFISLNRPKMKVDKSEEVKKKAPKKKDKKETPKES